MSKTLNQDQFAAALLRWHQQDGRSGLPWQNLHDPYAIWISEIMLQQTQVSTVLERYPRLMQRFPTVQALAAAPLDDVLAEWSGLGYYSRARNLHACAKQIVRDYGGHFPQELTQLESLAGIGRSTAGAIAAFAFNLRTPILDANVKRVLARLFGIKGPVQSKAVSDQLWQLGQTLLPQEAKLMPRYTQALMDFGATWCTARQPICLSQQNSQIKKCPFENRCIAKQSNQVLALPEKVIKTKSPEFDCEMLIIQAQEQILLQRRPTEGIWGGLWSLPESSWQKIALDSVVQSPKIKKSFSAKKLLQMILASGQVAEKAVDQFIKLSDKPAAGLLLKHVFTHRVLWIQSWRIQLNRPIPIAGTDYAWFKLNELDALGLPQAIRIIFQDWNLIPGADKVNE
ncbi:MAG: A/G-specific adenine glycosylase [Burkholderiaceae bacterium]|nr:A/G-specific adenine glycosylase [Burkholderiaceae bacterium]